jgi:cytochrome c oxidase subunit 2
MEPAEFEAWLREEERPAQSSEAPLAAQGQETFLALGCGACHTVRGTPADGVIGPDLTHVGGRVSLAAGVLANSPGNIERWIAATHGVKPGVHMPPFDMLNGSDLGPLAAYLSGLR